MNRLILGLLLLMAGTVRGQNEFTQLENMLERGLYNSAALVAGPALVESHPEDRRAHELYAQALLLSGDPAAARASLDAMLLIGEPEPVTASELNLAGLIGAAGGEAAASLPLLQAAFAAEARYGYAMDWGRVAWQAGQLDQAEAAYHAAAETELGQRQPWPWLDLGRLLLFQHRLDDAESALEQAIAVYEAFDTGGNLPSPAYVEAFYRLGQLAERRHRESGDGALLQQAASNYRNALVGDPNYGPALNALQRLETTTPE